MATITFELVSPEQLLLSVEATSVEVPGTEGDFGVFPGHAPIIASLRSGVVNITVADGEDRRIYIGGGLTEVNPRRMVLLAEEAIPVEDLDRGALEQKIKNTKEDLEDASDDETRRVAQGKLDHLEEMLHAL